MTSGTKAGAARTGVTTYATPTDREVVVTRVVEAPRKVAFDAWTNPKHVPNWMTGPEGWTMPICEIDLRPGGAWHFAWRKANGEEMDMRGTYREVVANERVVSTETWGPEWPETINTVVFAEKNGQTTITLTIKYPSKEARDAALKTGMKEGMELGFERLDKILKSIA